MTPGPLQAVAEEIARYVVHEQLPKAIRDQTQAMRGVVAENVDRLDPDIARGYLAACDDVDAWAAALEERSRKDDHT